MGETNTALVLGATGGIGGETAAALLRHGCNVVAMVRKPLHKTSETPSRLASVTWVIGNAANAGDVRAAAEGVQAIVHAVKPTGISRLGKACLADDRQLQNLPPFRYDPSLQNHV